MLLLAERCGLLAGREDDFVLILLTAYTGMRWGEVMGLERPYCRLDHIQVDWQLREFSGQLDKAPPKDDSYRAVDLPPFLAGLVSRQAIRAGRCTCAGRRPECGGEGEWLFLGADAGHHRRSNYAYRTFHPAAHGRFPQRGVKLGRPVLVDATQWPGRPLPPWPAAEPGRPFAPPTGRGHKPIPDGGVLVAAVGKLHAARAAARSQDLHGGGRRSGGSSGRPAGHVVPGIRGVYTHVSDGMRDELKAKLQRRWESALDERAELDPGSPLPILAEMLAARLHKGKVVSLRSA